MSQLQTIKTAIHEIAHAKLHAIDPTDPEQTNRPDSRTREVQAESVAYTVCQHYGLDTSEYSFGYVAGWSSGRELAELKASLEVIRSTAHELISALDEHLAELRQQREADLSAAQETAFVLDSGNTLFIQTCDSGYDYTLYGPDHTALDGGQLDAPGLTLPDAGQEALNLLGQTAAVSEVLLGDKLAAFQEAAEKANEIPTPIKIPDPAAEPTVTVLWSESDKLQDGEIMPLSVANRVFEELDTAQHTEREKDGYTGGWYDKTAFRIDFTLNGQPDNYEGRQDFGDGEGSLVQHIQNYHEYYAKDENWKICSAQQRPGSVGTRQGRAGNGADRVYPVPQTTLQSFRYGADGHHRFAGRTEYFAGTNGLLQCSRGLCAGLPLDAQPRPV